MSKRIPDIKETILTAARRTLMEEGYTALSMRRIAAQCGVAVGTLYNYYPAKDALTAAVMMEDWQLCVARMTAFAQDEPTLREGLTGLCRLLETFTDRYRSVWEQYGSGGRAVGYTARYHPVLRTQLAQPVRSVLEACGRTELLPVCDVLAETMLACALNTELGAEKFGLLASTWEMDKK